MAAPGSVDTRRGQAGVTVRAAAHSPREDADDELAVVQRRLDAAAEAGRDVELALVAAVLPLLDQVLAGPALRRWAQNRSVTGSPGRSSTVTSSGVTAGTGATTTTAPFAS